MLVASRILPHGSINTSKSRYVTAAQVKNEGYETLGGFVGSISAREQHLRMVIQDVHYKMGGVVMRNLRKQTRLMLIRQCVLPSVNHTMRNVDPDGCTRLYLDLKKDIQFHISTIGDICSTLGPGEIRAGHRPHQRVPRVKDTDLVCLPLRYGGLGLGDPTVQSKHAWEACQDKCEYLIQKWCQGHRGRTPKTQKERMEEYWKSSSDQLMRKLYRPMCLRVAANSEKSSSSWLTTIPHDERLQMTDEQVARGIRSRLLKQPDQAHPQRRKELDEMMVDEYKSAEYESTLVTSDTQHTISDDPRQWMSDSIVSPMAISMTTVNVSSITRNLIPTAPKDTTGLLKHYRKKIHEYVTRIQKKIYRREYDGYTHYPFAISTTGAFLSMTRKWIKGLKKRSSLNKSPSPVVQLTSVLAIKSLQ